jgi:hypothetical protein
MTKPDNDDIKIVESCGYHEGAVLDTGCCCESPSEIFGIHWGLATDCFDLNELENNEPRLVH